jgi:MerR family mercuric resistance operon transcriptional regulator
VGYRLYSPEAADRIRFIKRAQELGFSLHEIRELLDLRTNPGASRADIRKRGLAKIREIEHKIRDLEAIRKSLEQLTTACSGAARCGIVQLSKG